MHIATTLFSRAATLALIVGWGFTAVAAQPCRTQLQVHTEEGTQNVTLYRDAYGVPHIFGPSHAAVYAAYGYAAASDRLWQFELNRRAARGELAAILGERFVDVDRYVRSTGYTADELQQQFDALQPDLRAAIDAYVGGVNRRIAESHDANDLPYEFGSLGIAAQPWERRDVIAFGTFMLRRFGEIGGKEIDNYQLLLQLERKYSDAAAEAYFNDLLWRNDPAAPVTVPADPKTLVAEQVASHPRGTPRRPHLGSAPFTNPWISPEAAQPLWQSLGVPSRLGSFAYAVAPQNSATGVAMLYGGPQMGASAPEVLHEVQLVAPGLNVSGIGFAGVPFILIGANKHIAWTSTTAVGDNVDIYYESLCRGGQGTRFNGKCVPIQRHSETIQVRGGKPVEIEVLRTVHGPALLVPQLGVALAQKRAHWQLEARAFEGFWRFNHAASVEEFAAGMSYIATQHNFIYADDQGNIGYWQAGLVPVRAADGDSRLPQPGDGSSEWTGEFLPIPSSVNPAQGYLANWNNKPRADYDNADNRAFGPQWRLVDLEERLRGQVLSWDDMHEIATDIARVDIQGRESRYLLPYLLAALDAVPPASPAADAARQVLQDWSGNGFPDAAKSRHVEVGYVLFKAWKDHLTQTLYGADLGPQLRFATVDVLIHALDRALGQGASVPVQHDVFADRVAQQVLSSSFEAALEGLVREHGADLGTWRVERPMVELVHPVIGKVGEVPLANRATYAQVLTLGPNGVQGENIYTLGQSGLIRATPPRAYALDEHFKDLLPLYINYQYKPMLMLDAAP